MADSVLFDRSQHQTKLQKFLRAETINARKNIYTTKNKMLKWQEPSTISQWSNDRFTKHTCKAKWDGLQSWNTIWIDSHQHGWSKINHQYQSTVKTHGKEVVLVRLRQALKNSHKWLPCGFFYRKANILTLEVGLSQSEAKKAGELSAEEEDYLSADGFGEDSESL